MNVRFALLADSANISREGKLNILGEFNAIPSAQFPALHPSMCFVTSFEVGNTDIGRHSAELRYVDDDAHLVAPPLAWTFEVGGGAPGGETAAVPMVIPIQGLGIPRAGQFCIDLWCDGEFKKSCPFTAVISPPQG